MLDPGVRMHRKVRLMIGSPQELARRNREYARWGPRRGLVPVSSLGWPRLPRKRAWNDLDASSPRDDLLMSDPG